MRHGICSGSQSTQHHECCLRVSETMDQPLRATSPWDQSPAHLRLPKLSVFCRN